MDRVEFPGTHLNPNFEMKKMHVFRLNLVKKIYNLGLLAFLFCTSSVLAAPVLNVSVNSSRVLLGGDASYNITVQNTDSVDKGYNLSLTSVFSSDRVDPEGQITFSSASGNITPTTVTTDSGTGDTTIEFVDIKDIAASETYTFTMSVNLAGDATWEVMDDLIHNLTATVNTMPDGNGSDITDTDSDTSEVLPIALVQHQANQSTGVEQATGTLDRVYSYTINVQNNYTNATDNVTVIDTLVDGIEFLGITSGHTCSDSRSNTTGITTLTCNLGTMAAGELQTITFNTGVRYDYFGTDNGGTNRIHDDFDGLPVVTGTPIPNKAGLNSQVNMNAVYLGTPIPMQSDNATVTAAYATISKGGHISNGGNGDTINYTLTYTTSEYYDILDDDADDNNSSITIHDLIPDGQTYVGASANPAPTLVTVNGDGTTDMYWNSSILNGLVSSNSFPITFSTTVDNNWNPGELIVAGDSMTNVCDSHGEWDDQIDTLRANGLTDSNASAGFNTVTPTIMKEVEFPYGSDTWLTAANAVIGDTMRFRVRFNTDNGTTPLLSNINLGDITVTDWLPPGMTYNNDAVESHSVSSFSGPEEDGPPTPTTAGGLNGIKWNLGDVSKAGWWQAIFTATVNDTVAVTDGKKVNNLWKMTGINSFGAAYSDRDIVDITYYEPELTLTKSATTVPSPLKPNDLVSYTVTITNTGNAEARDILFKDTLDNYMDDVAPTVTSINLNGSPLSDGVGYVTPAYNGGTREWTIDFNDGAGIESNLPVGQSLVIVYQSTVNNDPGARRTLSNIATVSYSSQNDGSGRTVPGTSNTSDINTDNASINLPNASIIKSVAAGPYRIGDTIPYTLRMTVPQGNILYWPFILDRFERDGVTYVPGSATLSLVSGTPVAAAAFDGSTNPDPTIATTTNNRTDLRWYFTDPIDNRGQAANYVFELNYSVVYDGLEDNSSWEFFTPTNGDYLRNRARIYWNDIPNGTRTTNRNAASSNVDVGIDQPILATAKTVVSTGPYTTGSTIDYRVVITNNGQAIAYDVTWEDNLDATVGNAVLTSVTHSGSGLLASGTGFLENFTGNPLTIDFDGGSADTNLASGETITILYSTQVNDNIGAGATVNNTEDVDWSSQDETVVGERIYNDSADESGYTDDADNASVNTALAAFSKTITTPVSKIAEIGETISYAIRVTAPAETLLYSPTLADVVATNGIAYVPGSVAVVPVSGNPQVAATISADPAINTATPNPGTTLTFSFDADIDNADPSAQGDTDYVFDVTYDMVVTGLDDASAWIWDPSATGYSTTNTATLAWNDGVSNHSRTANETLSVVQPYLEITKNFDTLNVEGGNNITATVVIMNMGNGTAYELDAGADFSDTMAAGFSNPMITSLTHSTNGVLINATDYTFTVTGNDFEIEYDTAQTNLAAGESMTLIYTVDIDSSIGSGVNIQNAADVNYSSMSGAVANERIFDDSNPAEDEVDKANDNVITADATMVKAHTAIGGNATIGESFDYTITSTIPENTTIYNATITDVVPDGLTVTSIETLPVTGTATFTEQPNGTTNITWDMGDIVNNPTDQAIITIHVRVDDMLDGAVPLDGLSAIIDGDAQDTSTNNAVFQWDNADTGGTRKTVNDDVTVTIAEPKPTITKAVNAGVAGIDDVMHYTVVIGNEGVSTLYNINWKDTLPGDLFNGGTTPKLTSVTHSVNGLLTSGTNYDENFSVNPVTISFDVLTETTLAPGETITILYDTIVLNTVTLGATLTNTAAMTASSQPSYNLNRRNYNGSAQTSIVITNTSIGDKVWYDTNANGIQDGGESGIGNVGVELRNAAGDPMDNPMNPGTAYVLQTNSDGSYLFTNLTAGNYRVYFETPTGYMVTPKGQGGNNALDSDADPLTKLSDIILIGHDTNVSNVDAGFRTASIGDRVWNDTNGNGIQESGETNIENAVVKLLDGSGNPFNNPLTAIPYVLATDSAGNYKFENLSAGNYILEFETPTGFFGSVPNMGNNGVDSNVNPITKRTAPIAVAAGASEMTIDGGFYLVSSIAGKIWDDVDKDGIQDIDEDKVFSNIAVKLLDGSKDPVVNSLTGSAYEVSTAEDGTYKFENLIAGNYIVEFGIESNFDISPDNEGSNNSLDSDIDKDDKTTGIITLVPGTESTHNDAGVKRRSGGGSGCIKPIIGDMKAVNGNYEIMLTLEPSLYTLFNTNAYANTEVKFGDTVLTSSQYTYTKDNNGYHLIQIPNVTKTQSLALTVFNRAKSGSQCSANKSFEIKVDTPEEPKELPPTEDPKEDFKPAPPEEPEEIEESEEKPEEKTEEPSHVPEYMTLKPIEDLLTFMIVIPRTGNTIPEKLANAYGAFTILEGVTRNYEYYEASLALKHMGLLNGRSDGMALNEPIIRAEVAKMLLTGSSTTIDTNLNNGPKMFTDVKDGAWYEIYVNNMVDKGFMKGYPKKGLFGTKDNLTYGEMAKLLIKTFGLSNVEDSTSGHWATNYVNVVIDKGLLPKGLDGEKNFKRVLTRGEVADFVYRTIIMKGSKDDRYVEKITINIPKFDINLPSSRTLLSHPSTWLADLTETGGAFYDDTFRDRTILFAHSSVWPFDPTPYGPIFKPLIGGTLVKGDLFEITRNGKTRTYEITKNMLVDESETGYLTKSEFVPSDTNFIVFTCDKDVTDRWIYYAKEIK